MKIKTIKNIDEQTWKNFKVLSTKMGISMGILLKIMTKEFEKNNEKFWNSIFDKEKYLSNKEAEEISKLSKNLRKEKGFRI